MFMFWFWKFLKHPLLTNLLSFRVCVIFIRLNHPKPHQSRSYTTTNISIKMPQSKSFCSVHSIYLNLLLFRLWLRQWGRVQVLRLQVHRLSKEVNEGGPGRRDMLDNIMLLK